MNYNLPPDEQPPIDIKVPKSALDILKRRYDDDEVDDILRRVNGGEWLYYWNLRDGMPVAEALDRRINYDRFKSVDSDGTDGLRHDATGIESDGQLRLL